MEDESKLEQNLSFAFMRLLLYGNWQVYQPPSPGELQLQAELGPAPCRQRQAQGHLRGQHPGHVGTQRVA